MNDDDIRAAMPPGGDPSPAAGDAAMQGRGCLIAGVGMAVLVLTPAAGAWVAIPKPVGVGLFLFGVVALVAGAGLGMLGAAREPSRETDEGSPRD